MSDAVWSYSFRMLGFDDARRYKFKMAEMERTRAAEDNAGSLGFRIGTDFRTMKPIYWIPCSEGAYINIGNRQLR
ncbi:MAG: hypothetical protein AABX14_01385 [Candidatus Aenigmatarchaeota archaeon]